MLDVIKVFKLVIKHLLRLFAVRPLFFAVFRRCLGWFFAVHFYFHKILFSHLLHHFLHLKKWFPFILWTTKLCLMAGNHLQCILYTLVWKTKDSHKSWRITTVNPGHPCRTSFTNVPRISFKYTYLDYRKVLRELWSSALSLRLDMPRFLSHHHCTAFLQRYRHWKTTWCTSFGIINFSYMCNDHCEVSADEAGRKNQIFHFRSRNDPNSL